MMRSVGSFGPLPFGSYCEYRKGTKMSVLAGDGVCRPPVTKADVGRGAWGGYVGREGGDVVRMGHGSDTGGSRGSYPSILETEGAAPLNFDGKSAL